MPRTVKWSLVALLGLLPIGPARSDGKQILADRAAGLTHKGRPARAAIALSRPAGRAAAAVARGAGRAVVAGKVVRPGRRAAWLGRAAARGVGRAARGVGRAAAGAAKVGRPFRLFKRWNIIP